MKIKSGFVLQKIVDEYIVVPVGEEADTLHGIIKLNSSGGFLWECLSQKSMTKPELERELRLKYGIDSNKAKRDVEAYIDKLQAICCIEE